MDTLEYKSKPLPHKPLSKKQRRRWIKITIAALLFTALACALCTAWTYRDPSRPDYTLPNGRYIGPGAR
jgi:hypothetical protein